MKEIKDLRVPPLGGIPISKKVSANGSERVVTEYLDIPLCFDIEAYSFLEGGEKRAVMWAWGLAIGEECYLGREWGELLEALETISEAWGLGASRRVIIWVHNLSYDFSFFHRWITWDKVFPLDSRVVCYGSDNMGFDWRCSYILTQKSCDALGKALVSHSVRKLTGTIDYSEPRHPGTLLRPEEVEYLEHDCLVVTAYIGEQIEAEGGVCHIPLTHTGYCRRYVRKACFRDSSKSKKFDMLGRQYRDLMGTLTMDRFVYESCRRAFQGGFTHANPQHAGVTLDDVVSLDVVSDYPAQILSGLYPMTPPEYVRGFDSEATFLEEIEKGCSVFTLELIDVKSKIHFDHYISRSHCILPAGTQVQEDNGRIVWCDHLITTITNVDFFIIRRCYDFKIKSVSGFIKWGWGYLPKPIIESTLYMYEQKTVLKGEPGKESEYALLKALLNAIYGMMVTDPLRERIPYDVETNSWGERGSEGDIRYRIPLTPEESEEALAKYNKDFQRFTYYPWGVFITAYARHMLWSGILEFGEDYVYSDTDSLKVLHYEAHKEWVEKYNGYMTGKIRKCLEYYGLDPERACPPNETGEKKQLGVWDFDGRYSHFKTLGAKRYIVGVPEDGGEALKITIAGVSKKSGSEYISRQAEKEGVSPFDFFTNGMVIPPGMAGKLIPTYGDEEVSGTVVDRDGMPYTYHEKSFVHLAPGGYTMTLDKYVEYLELLQKGFLH